MLKYVLLVVEDVDCYQLYSVKIVKLNSLTEICLIFKILIFEDAGKASLK